MAAVPMGSTVSEHTPELTFPHHFGARTEEHPNRTFVIDPAHGHRATYAEHLHRVLVQVGALRGLGVQPGDRFAVLSANSHRYLELWHAALFGAGVITPLNHRLAPPELAAILRDSGAEVVLADRTYAHLLPGVPVVPLDDALAGEPATPPALHEADVSALLYTGGTTGRPKGVLLSHRAQVLNQYHAQMTMPVQPGWRYLQHTPMYHAGASVAVLRAGMTGGTVVLIPGFDAGGFLRAVEEHRIACTVLLPTLIARVLGHPQFEPDRLSSLRRISYGGAPMPAGLLDRLRSVLPDLECTQVYGMTESCSGLTCLTADDHRSGGNRLRSVGRAYPGVRLEIRDDAGHPLPSGVAGEVHVCGGNLFSGYLGSPDLTAAVLVDGWFRTGDIGRLDDEGYLYLLDRAADMIISGGENVYSAEVELALSTHPAVDEAAVIGLPDPDWGEVVCAVVRLGRGASPVSEQEIRDHARRTIAGYKVPKRVVFRSAPFPLSGANKIAKQLLRNEYAGPISSPKGRYDQ